MPHETVKVISLPDGVWTEKSSNQYRNPEYMPPHDPAKTGPISRTKGNLNDCFADRNIEVQEF